LFDDSRVGSVLGTSLRGGIEEGVDGMVLVAAAVAAAAEAVVMS